MSSAFYETLDARIARAGRVAVATLAERRRSVPREVGATLLVSSLGEIIGPTPITDDNEANCAVVDVLAAAGA
ncbi:MAG TPA: XdhC family protein [Thermodesulfobacteriota bacterium]